MQQSVTAEQTTGTLQSGKRGLAAVVMAVCRRKTDMLNSFEEQVRGADGQTVLRPLTAADTLIRGRLTEEPAPIDALMHCYGKPMLPRGIVGGIVAEGGAGKTYLIPSSWSKQ